MGSFRSPPSRQTGFRADLSERSTGQLREHFRVMSASLGTILVELSSQREFPHGRWSVFERYIGIDYSGGGDSGCKSSRP